MGRPLFSTLYAPLVVTPKHPDLPDLPRCEKWSMSNPFDPDSDEFYDGATREAFTDTEAWLQEQEAVRELLVAQAQNATESSASSEANESDGGSPMAVGIDDPALLIADAFPNGDWNSQWAAIPATAHDLVVRISSSTETDSGTRTQRRVRHHRSSTMSNTAIPSSSTPIFTDATVTTPASPPQSPTLRRTVNITPITIPNEPSTPSPVSSATPSTPTDTLYQREMASMLTPSPPPTVSPHVYTWRHAPLVVPTSPLANMGNNAGPLTNASARVSLTRLNLPPTRVRIQNAAVSINLSTA